MSEHSYPRTHAQFTAWPLDLNRTVLSNWVVSLGCQSYEYAADSSGKLTPCNANPCYI